MEKYTDEYQFLSDMCDTLLVGDFESSVAFFHLPCVVVNNQHKYIFNNENELKQWLSAYCKRLHVESREQFSFTLRKTVAMSPTVKFSQVHLKGLMLLQENKELDISFTLSNDIDETLKIIVVVIDDI